jgi:hypothetical protein
LTRQFDNYGVALFRSAVQGTAWSKVTLTQTDATDRQTLMTVVLATAVVSGYVVSGSATAANSRETVGIGLGAYRSPTADLEGPRSVGASQQTLRPSYPDDEAAA